MPILPDQILSDDLDHLIECRKVTLTGVSPIAIKDLEYDCDISPLVMGRSVEVQGIEQELNVSIRLNSRKYSTLPSLGSVLLGEGGRYYKVFEITQDEMENPILTTFNCIERYQGE